MLADFLFAALCDLFRLLDAFARIGDAIAQFVTPRGAA